MPENNPNFYYLKLHKTREIGGVQGKENRLQFSKHFLRRQSSFRNSTQENDKRRNRWWRRSTVNADRGWGGVTHTHVTFGALVPHYLKYRWQRAKNSRNCREQLAGLWSLFRPLSWEGENECVRACANVQVCMCASVCFRILECDVTNVCFVHVRVCRVAFYQMCIVILLFGNSTNLNNKEIIKFHVLHLH